MYLAKGRTFPFRLIFLALKTLAAVQAPTHPRSIYATFTKSASRFAKTTPFMA
jgi:hypothetical protein